jgi:hypothetical protein
LLVESDVFLWRADHDEFVHVVCEECVGVVGRKGDGGE